MKEAKNTLLEIIVGKLIGNVKHGGDVNFARSLVANTTKPSDGNALSICTGYFSTYENGNLKTIGEIGAEILNLMSIAKVLSLITYQTTADYVGEIQVLVKMGTQEITYAKTYDFYGTPQEKIPSVKIEMHEKSVAGMIPSKCALYSDVVLDAWNYENVFKLDCMTIIDGEKHLDKEEVYKNNNDRK